MVQSHRPAGYLTEISNVILPLSRSPIISEALKEWNFTGDIEEYKPPDYLSCELCGYPRIAYGYEIKNIFTARSLRVGCVCVKKFSNGYTINHIGKLHVINTLRQLRERVDKIDINNLIKYYSENGAFTPKQLLLVLNLFNRYRIPHIPEHFKLKIRRNREKQQFSNLKTEELRLISPCITGYQKNWRNEREL